MGAEGNSSSMPVVRSPPTSSIRRNFKKVECAVRAQKGEGHTGWRWEGVSRDQNSRPWVKRWSQGWAADGKSEIRDVEVNDVYERTSLKPGNTGDMAVLRVVPTAGLQAEPSSGGSHSLMSRLCLSCWALFKILKEEQRFSV